MSSYPAICEVTYSNLLQQTRTDDIEDEYTCGVAPYRLRRLSALTSNYAPPSKTAFK